MLTLDELEVDTHPVCLELRRFRTQVLRISQTELAAMLGVTRDTIARHELGVNHPVAETVEKYRDFIARWSGKSEQLKTSRWRHHGK